MSELCGGMTRTSSETGSLAGAGGGGADAQPKSAVAIDKAHARRIVVFPECLPRFQCRAAHHRGQTVRTKMTRVVRLRAETQSHCKQRRRSPREGHASTVRCTARSAAFVALMQQPSHCGGPADAFCCGLRNKVLAKRSPLINLTHG